MADYKNHAIFSNLMKNHLFPQFHRYQKFPKKVKKALNSKIPNMYKRKSVNKMNHILVKSCMKIYRTVDNVLVVFQWVSLGFDPVLPLPPGDTEHQMASLVCLRENSRMASLAYHIENSQIGR